MNTFMNQMTKDANIDYTENYGITRKSTESKVLDMFAMGGSYRNRSDKDVILLFKNAIEEDPQLAVKCLFYVRDAREGQGERRFFRVAFRWLADNYPEIAKKNIENIPEYGRYDDLYCLVGTSIEKDMFAFIKKQLALDISTLTDEE